MRVLFVCLGNICRSPTAEAVLRKIAAREAPDLALDIDSAGTADYHIGEPPDVRSQAAAAARGYDLSSLRARQVALTDYEDFDLLLAMDENNLAELHAAAPEALRPRVQLFMDYAPQAGVTAVPDPYYGDSAGFERVLDLAELASRGLLVAIRNHRRRR